VPRGSLIYLDHHATTPIDPRVLATMLPWLREEFGNEASAHAWGDRARAVVEDARSAVADVLGADASEIVFTSGATESNNIAILGATRPPRARTRHVVTTAIEHASVLAPMQHLGTAGFDLTIVRVSPAGVVDMDALRRSVRSDTLLVSVMAANNEVGTIQPLAEIDAMLAERSARFGRPILLHTDDCQGLAKVPLAVCPIGSPCRPVGHLISLSAHKIYGPKGVGALYVRRGTPISPVLFGGSQEHGLRPGTVNVPGIVGFGAAARILASDEGRAEAERMAALRDRLLEILRDGLGDRVHVNGAIDPPGAAAQVAGTWSPTTPVPRERLPQNLHVTFLGVCPIALGDAVSETVAVSASAACRSRSSAPSHVLAAMGAPGIESGAPVRFGLGRSTTQAEIERAAELFVRAARSLAEGVCPTSHGEAA